MEEITGDGKKVKISGRVLAYVEGRKEDPTAPRQQVALKSGYSPSVARNPSMIEGTLAYRKLAPAVKLGALQRIDRLMNEFDECDSEGESRSTIISMAEKLSRIIGNMEKSEERNKPKDTGDQVPSMWKKARVIDVGPSTEVVEEVTDDIDDVTKVEDTSIKDNIEGSIFDM